MCSLCVADVGWDLACCVDSRGKVEGVVAASDETARDVTSSIMYTCIRHVAEREIKFAHETEKRKRELE